MCYFFILFYFFIYLFIFLARPIVEWVKKFLLSFIALEDGKRSGICCLNILFG